MDADQLLQIKPKTFNLCMCSYIGMYVCMQACVPGLHAYVHANVHAYVTCKHVYPKNILYTLRKTFCKDVIFLTLF